MAGLDRRCKHSLSPRTAQGADISFVPQAALRRPDEPDSTLESTPIQGVRQLGSRGDLQTHPTGIHSSFDHMIFLKRCNTTFRACSARTTTLTRSSRPSNGDRWSSWRSASDRFEGSLSPAILNVSGYASHRRLSLTAWTKASFHVVATWRRSWTNNTRRSSAPWPAHCSG